MEDCVKIQLLDELKVAQGDLDKTVNDTRAKVAALGKTAADIAKKAFSKALLPVIL